MPAKLHTMRELFELRVVRSENCWAWIGSKTQDGYGKLKHGCKYWIASRFAWTLYNGEIPDGLEVCHNCDNRLCVNPDHLFLGTTLANVQDCVAKMRHAHGETHGRARLTEDDVRTIRKSYRRSVRGCGIYTLARRFGVARSTIKSVIDGTNWKHVQ